MKVWVVVDRVDGIVEGVWSNEEHAIEYAAQFVDNDNNYYDMDVMEYHIRDSSFGPHKDE